MKQYLEHSHHPLGEAIPDHLGYRALLCILSTPWLSPAMALIILVLSIIIFWMVLYSLTLSSLRTYILPESITPMSSESA